MFIIGYLKKGVKVAQVYGDKVYINESLSGPSESQLRINNKIHKVDSYGNVVENSNGLGLFNSVLMGYNFKYPVAVIDNLKFDEVLAGLEVSYEVLQTLSGEPLKIELLKLYNNLPSESMISITIYDSNGKVTNLIDQRRNELIYTYDEFQRLKYITDANNNILEHKKYNKKNN